MATENLTESELDELISLLEVRLKVIADTDLRDRDPDAQMKQLQEASEAIDAFYLRCGSRIPFRLRHFLERASFSKALDWAREAKS